MKIGICASVEQATSLAHGTMDYAELNLTHLAMMTDEEFGAAMKLLSEKGIVAEVTNCFFPGTIRLCGKDMSIETICEYAKGALYRAAKLGIHMSVLGSGGARRALEDENLADCKKQMEEVTYTLGEVAKEFDSIVLLEPLNKTETNIINSVSEGANLVRKLSHPNVMLLADLYHMGVEKEPIKSVTENADIIKHIHIANPEGRVFPAEEDGVDYTALKMTIEKAGYDARISIEGKANGDFKENAEESLRFLKKVFS